MGLGESVGADQPNESGPGRAGVYEAHQFDPIAKSLAFRQGAKVHPRGGFKHHRDP